MTSNSVDASVLRQAGGTAGDVDRDCEADPDEHVLSGGVDEPGHDSDDLAFTVQQRSTGVAGVHRGVDLDQTPQDDVVARLLEGTVQPGDDAGADGPVQPERVADHEGVAADLGGIRVAQDGRHQVGGRRVRLNHRDV